MEAGRAAFGIDDPFPVRIAPSCRADENVGSCPLVAHKLSSLVSRAPLKMIGFDIRLLFAYDHARFQEPMVGRHEFICHFNQRRQRSVSEVLDFASPCVHGILRLPGIATRLALLSSENLA